MSTIAAKYTEADLRRAYSVGWQVERVAQLIADVRAETIARVVKPLATEIRYLGSDREERWIRVHP